MKLDVRLFAELGWKIIDRIERGSPWYTNCRANRLRGAKICGTCPLRELIEVKEDYLGKPLRGPTVGQKKNAVQVWPVVERRHPRGGP